jgi:hypothetical protein
VEFQKTRLHVFELHKMEQHLEYPGFQQFRPQAFRSPPAKGQPDRQFGRSCIAHRLELCHQVAVRLAGLADLIAITAGMTGVRRDLRAVIRQ